MPLEDQFWGDRTGTLVDPFGHRWYVSTHREDLTQEEIGARAAELFGGS
jgi:PhnB protein